MDISNSVDSSLAQRHDYTVHDRFSPLFLYLTRRLWLWYCGLLSLVRRPGRYIHHLVRSERDFLSVTKQDPFLGQDKIFLQYSLFSAFDVDEEEHHPHEEADGTDGDVGDAQEGVLAAQERGGREDDALGAAELGHAEAYKTAVFA